MSTKTFIIPVGGEGGGGQGIQGIQGIQGATGMQGATGEGLQGIQGIAGQDGADGLQGIQGIAGENGIQGATGETGLQGIQGIAGQDGVDGLQGIQGIAGQDGVDGLQGIQGIAGADGIQGIQGVAGQDGQGVLPKLDISQMGSQELYILLYDVDNYLATNTLYWGDYPITAITPSAVVAINGEPIVGVLFQYSVGIIRDQSYNTMLWCTTKGALLYDLQGMMNEAAWYTVDDSFSMATYDALYNYQEKLTAGEGISIEYNEFNEPIISATTLQGIQGVSGADGIQGIQGITGLQGPAGEGGGSSAWYGSMAQFQAIAHPDENTDYYISEISYNELKDKPNFASLQDINEAKNDVLYEVREDFEHLHGQYMTMQQFQAITPKENYNYFIEGNTIAMVVTFTDQTTATYNVVVDD